jgi:acetoin:2,6-dichlorophenolindophenol oxidoreductase subunit beta
MIQSKELSFCDSINLAHHHLMEEDKSVMTIGLGVTDPKRIFGTTKGLVEAFGEQRVFDTPTSENAITGIGVGLALRGFKPIMVHQRLDFFLLAMDQLVNSAAKWRFMFGGQDSVPLVIRLIVGRGWGQGPTHSQSLQSWFAHVPGLKVVMPTFPQDAYDLLKAAVQDPNPVVFLEHRWLHQQVGKVQLDNPIEALGKARVVRRGRDLTIVSYSISTIESLKAAEILMESGIDCEVIDLRTLSPIDWDTVLNSVRKTGKILAIDSAQEQCSIASEVVAHCSLHAFADLDVAPQRLALPQLPIPTSFGLTTNFYFSHDDIVRISMSMMNKRPTRIDPVSSLPRLTKPHDVPGDWFRGPF